MKKKRNSQKSKQNLLEAAIDVFSKHGPEAATIDEICSKAGLNKRMLYHYFGNKKLLYQEALSHMYEKLLSLNISLKLMLLPPEELLYQIIYQYHTFLKNHKNFVRLICYENLYGGGTIRKLKLVNQKAPVIDAIQLALEKGKSEKCFRDDIDVQKTLITIMGLCFFYFSNEFTMNKLVGGVSMTKANLNKQIKHIVDLVLNGIKTYKL